jgi:DNA processing protein
MNFLVRWFALSRQKGLGPLTLWRLFDHVKNPRELFLLSAKELSDLSKKPISLFTSAFSRNSLQSAEITLRRIQKSQSVHCPWQDFPEFLRHIHTPPAVLFSEGHGLLSDDRIKVALVGSRKATLSGLRNAHRLAVQLAERGVVVVSGLARGIDTAALEGCLSVQGRTLAVLGHGLHTIYPKENGALARRIAESGLLISEHEPGVDPRRHHFPRRNRILSGLCHAIVVVEAHSRSGALITARFALEQGREVLAVPGPIDLPQAQGPLDLIQQGAGVARHADDILDSLCLFTGPRKKHRANADTGAREKLPPLQAEIRRLLRSEALSLPSLSQRLGAEIPDISQAMTVLEIAGLVKQQQGLFSNA